MEEKTTPRAEDFEATLSDLFAEFEDSVGDDGDTDVETPEKNTSDGDDTAAEEETPSEEPEDSNEAVSGEEPEEPTDAEESPKAPEESSEAPEEPKDNEEPAAEDSPEESAYERQEREDLEAVVAAHPEVKLGSLRDLGRMQYAKYIGMRLAGFTALEAYDEICPAKAPETPDAGNEPAAAEEATDAPRKPASKPASKGHLGSVAPKSHGAPEGMTREELSAARDLFPSLSEKEIHSLYRRTKKN